ncbi:MAG: DUF3630 family protein [Chthoniobacterales bacterium]
MKSFDFDSLAVRKMASGHLCLNLTERVNWEEFPNFVDQLIGLIGLRIINQSDGPDMRLWEVEIESHALSLVFDDYPLMVSLEASDEKGDIIIEKTHQILIQQNDTK